MALSKEELSKRMKESAQKRSKEIYNKTHKLINKILYKQCSCHKEYFPDEDDWIPCTEKYFYKNKSNTSDGLHTWCKKCALKKRKQYQLENYVEGGKLKKYCQRVYIEQKDKMKERDKERNKSEKRKEQNRRNLKKWQENNRDKVNEYSKKRGQKNHRINKKEWESCLDYFDHKCAYCGMTEEEHRKLYNQGLHKEHVIDCGRNDLKNCIPSCKICNSEKHLDSLNDWYNKDNTVYDKDKYHRIYQWIRYDCKKYIMKKRKNKQYNKKNTEYWKERSN